MLSLKRSCFNLAELSLLDRATILVLDKGQFGVEVMFDCFIIIESIFGLPLFNIVMCLRVLICIILLH